MIYQRRELVDLVHKEAPELQPLLIALMWFASHGNPNLISGIPPHERYGLLQIDLMYAQQYGFTDQPTKLLEPPTNIQVGHQLLTRLGLVQFCGRELAHQIPAILHLADFLEAAAVERLDEVQTTDNWQSQ